MSNIGELGRIGGEEWLVLIKSIDEQLIKSKMSELRSKYTNSLPRNIPAQCNLSFSSGVLICTGQYSNYEKMLTDVDKALYKAKQNGRGQDVYV